MPGPAGETASPANLYTVSSNIWLICVRVLLFPPHVLEVITSTMTNGAVGKFSQKIPSAREAMVYPFAANIDVARLGDVPSMPATSEIGNRFVSAIT